MKIAKIQLAMLRVPLKTPFKTALRTVNAVEDVVVVVTTDTGEVGYGEAPATAVITGDTHGSIIDAIRNVIGPRLIGQEIANLNRITGLIQGAMENNFSAKAALEIAIYDLWAQLYKAPLYRMTGRLSVRDSRPRLSCDSAITGTLSSFASALSEREISEISVARFSPVPGTVISCR